MGRERDPSFGEGSLSLQASLTLPELPHRIPPFTKRRFVLLFVMAGFCGEVFVSLRGGFFEVELRRKQGMIFAFFTGLFSCFDGK